MKTYLKDLTPEEIIKRLKNGEIIKSEEDDDIIIRYYDGVIYSSSKRFGGYKINVSFVTDAACKYYFETEEPFEIKETGLYKTRDGRKVFVSHIGDSDNTYNVSGIILNDYLSKNWTIKGRINTGYKGHEDIISKWED